MLLPMAFIGTLHNSEFALLVVNPIPTGCCHVTLIYGLIPPMAGRNRVKWSLVKILYIIKKYIFFLNSNGH